MGGAVGVAFVIGPDQQAVGHIANKLTADIPPGADTHTLMFNLEIGLIIDITEAQCPGIQRVFIGRRRAANHRTVKLGTLYSFAPCTPQRRQRPVSARSGTSLPVTHQRLCSRLCHSAHYSPRLSLTINI